MAPPLIVRAYLDVRSYLKSANSVNTANVEMGDTALGMGANFKRSAQEVVTANVTVAQSQRILIADYAKLEAAAIAGSDAQKIAAKGRISAQKSLDRVLGETTVATSAMGTATQKSERDLGKLSRGALAGTGLFSKLGRSLAFASGGFIAVAGGATLVAESIRQAESLGVAQRQVDRQLQTSGKSWASYGSRINSVLLKEGHLAGFTRSELLTAFGYLIRVGGNVARSLKLTGLAADVARGRNISLSAASISLSKALGGSVTALRRLGIIVPHNVTTMQALAYVQAKFTGQAEAGTSASQRFSASLSDAGATAGTVLLPTFERLTTRFGNWLQRMNESGKLTKDVNEAVSILGVGFHTLGKAISIVDKITGGFGHTLLVVGEIWAGIKIAGWITSLKALSVEWGIVGASAAKAAEAEAAAVGVSAAGIATGDLRAAALAGPGRSVLSRVAGGLGGRVAGGIGLAITGQIGGQIAGSVIPGQAGKTTQSALQYAGLGAAIGTFAEPGFGTAVGAGIGVIVGSLATLIHQAPSLQQSLQGDADALKSLGAAGRETALSITSLKLQRLQLQGSLGSQRANVASTRRLTGPGSQELRLSAELQLKQTEEQLAIVTDQLNAAENKQANIRRQRAQASEDEKKRVLDLAKSYQHLALSIRGLKTRGTPVTSEKDIATLMQSVRDGTDKASNATEQFTEKLAQMADRSSPRLRNTLNQISALVIGLGNIKKLTPLEITTIFKNPNGLAPKGPQGPIHGGISAAGGGVATWATFQLNLTEQIAQAQAALTKGTKDDVVAARKILARIKRLIAKGLSGNALLQALQEEANALATIQSAADARKQAAQAAADAAKARASTYNVPGSLQLAQAKAEAYGKSETAILKKIIAAAQHAIDAGGKNWQGLVAAYQTIASARAQLEQDAVAAIIPLRLQLQLARVQARGGDQTSILRKMKAALERALKAAKGNIQKQIDILNQITAINSQLQTGATNAYGDYKKASLRAETQGLGLTPEQRRALEARLSQIGPGGTHPMSGTGAAGFIIDPETGRPIHRGRRRQGSQYGGGGSGTPTINARFDLHVYLEGKQLEAVVTQRQQKNNTRRPTQRRGPNAATR